MWLTNYTITFPDWVGKILQPNSFKKRSSSSSQLIVDKFEIYFKTKQKPVMMRSTNKLRNIVSRSTNHNTVKKT